MSGIIYPVAIALGSNLGDRMKYLEMARKALSEDVLLQMRASSVYESDPWLGMEQPVYLNQVVVGLSEWKPASILHYIKSLEVILGRKHGERFGPREIDLDLIAYDDLVVNADGLEVPHPRMRERDFVLAPLAEVWPSWVHPETHESVGSLLAKLPRNARIYHPITVPPTTVAPRA